MENVMRSIRHMAADYPVISAIALITVFLLVFYSNSFTGQWHYDDFHHIKENINIRKIDNIKVFFKDASTFSRNPQTKMYRPLLMSTHAINYQMGLMINRDGYNVVPYHVTNFLFHLLTSLAIFFSARWIFTYRVRISDVSPTLIGAFAALLFGLHTINTETIVYLSSRSSVMAAMFTFWAFYLYLKASAHERTLFVPLLFSTFLFGCGLLSKEITITLPAMLVYYEYLINYGDRDLRKLLNNLLVRISPYAVVSLGYLYLRHIMLSENLIKHALAKGGTAAAPNFTAQLATQSKVWIYYIREWLWPTSLSIDKPFAVSRGFGEPAVIISVLLLITMFTMVIRGRHRVPLVTFGILWFFTALLPTSVFRLNVVMNDHRMYLPGLGATLAFTYIAAKLYSHYREIGGKRLEVFTVIALATLLLMGLGTFKRNMAFSTEETMWKDVILKDKKSVRGYNNLGIYYEQHGEWDKALAHYQQTIKLAPMFPNPYINIGNVYHKKKEYEKAEQWMKRAIQLDPRSALANYNLGNILREAGKTEEAVGAYTRALQLNPRYIEAANNLANIYFKMRNYPEAIKYYQQALFIDPTFAMSYYNIALANENMARLQDALSNYQQFLKYWLGDPKYATLAQRKIQQLRQQLPKTP